MGSLWDCFVGNEISGGLERFVLDFDGLLDFIMASVREKLVAIFNIHKT